VGTVDRCGVVNDYQRNEWSGRRSPRSVNASKVQSSLCKRVHAGVVTSLLSVS
jgi:hypothetical protein